MKSSALFCLIFLPFFCCTKKKDKDPEPQVITYPPTPATQPPPYYKIELIGQGVIPAKRTISFSLRVTNKDNNGVATLSNNDFKIFENGRVLDLETAKLVESKPIPYVIRTVLLLDISSSITSVISQFKKSVIDFIQKKAPSQYITIFVFDKNTRLLQDFSKDGTQLISKINSIPESNLENTTNLYQAIRDVSDGSRVTWNEFETRDSIGIMQLIIYTDGRHNADPSLDENFANQQLFDKSVFVVALKSGDLNEEPLKLFASGTGNKNYFLSENITDLSESFANVQKIVQNDANSYYNLSYRSTISVPKPFDNTVKITIKNSTSNSNGGSDEAYINTSFNSVNFQ